MSNSKRAFSENTSAKQTNGPACPIFSGSLRWSPQAKALLTRSKEPRIESLHEGRSRHGPIQSQLRLATQKHSCANQVLTLFA